MGAMEIVLRSGNHVNIRASCYMTLADPLHIQPLDLTHILDGKTLSVRHRDFALYFNCLIFKDDGDGCEKILKLQQQQEIHIPSKKVILLVLTKAIYLQVRFESTMCGILVF